METFSETFSSKIVRTLPLLKSVNLHYNKLVRWADGTNDSSTKLLMFQVLFFFIKSCKILCKNPFNLFFYKITKMKIKSFECPKSIRNYEKKNTWNVKRFVDDSFAPSAQQTSVLNSRLTGFKIIIIIFTSHKRIFNLRMFCLHMIVIIHVNLLSVLLFRSQICMKFFSTNSTT